ncbi:beta-lactamase family protein [Gammaproteobacteria bacterium]|nr:beta-lactamase family protein [Gammaproteobacteria bacterium]
MRIEKLASAFGLFCLTNFCWLAEAQQLEYQYLEEKIASVVDPLVDEQLIPGFYLSIHKDGQKIIERIRGYADEEEGLVPSENTLYAIASMTKPLTALAILHLIENSDVSLDASLSEYLPEFSDMLVAEGGSYDSQLRAAKVPITIRQLLTHTSGFTYSSDITGVGDIADTYNSLRLLTLEANSFSRWGSLHDHVIKLAELPLVAEPGEKFTYSVSYDVLSRLLEVITGQEFGTYMEENIFSKLGMQDTHFIVPEKKKVRLSRLYSPRTRTYQIPGKPVMYQESDLLEKAEKNFGLTHSFSSGGTGLLTTAADYSKFLSFLIYRGAGFDLKLSQRSFDLMLKDQTSDTLGINMLTESLGRQTKETVLSYGLGIKLVQKPEPSKKLEYDFLFWSGAFNTHFWLDPDKKTFGIFMTQFNPTRYPVAEKIDELLDNHF